MTVVNLFNLVMWFTGMVVWFFVLLVFITTPLRGKPLSEEAKERAVELVSISEMSGREIQQRLLEEGLMSKRSIGPPFYEAMDELVKTGMLVRNDDDVVDEYTFQRRWLSEEY